MLDVGKIIPITDFFILITCSSRRHVKALSQEIIKVLKKKKVTVPGIEGSNYGWWMLIDAGSVVVHLFEEEARKFYDLDHLWADAEIMDWQKKKGA